MSPRRNTGRHFDWEQEKLNRIVAGKIQSELTYARVRGMRIRAAMNPPTACVGTFPFGPSRTCAEWRPIDAYRERSLKATRPEEGL